MFMTGLFPYAEYALPAISGIILCSLVIEFNKKTALVAYCAVSIISILAVPNKEPALMFVCFFGYYPILKSILEHLKNRVFEWIFKLSIFNLSILLAYFVAIYLFNMSELINEFGAVYQYGALILLLLGNVVFVIYDIALSGVIVTYCQKLRPKIKKML